MLNWRELSVENEGEVIGTLGELVDRDDGECSQIELAEDGSVSEWSDYYIAAPGEESDWDTPREAVDWTGLRKALGHTDEP